jgi:hypothetical protein
MEAIRRLIAAYLPMPAALDEALAAGTVRVVRNDRGATVYVIAAGCGDKEAIRQAIDRRTQSELAAMAVLGVVVGMAVAGVVAALR